MKDHAYHPRSSIVFSSCAVVVVSSNRLKTFPHHNKDFKDNPFYYLIVSSNVLSLLPLYVLNGPFFPESRSADNLFQTHNYQETTLEHFYIGITFSSCSNE
jgi:hypothetical protein